MSLRAIAVLGAGVISTVSAHGHVSGIVIGGKYYPGYDASFQYESPPPTVIGWSTPEVTDNGFVAPTAYDTADIICHIGATPAGASAKVAAGDTVKLEWTPWPDSHHGPVIDYLAKCSGSCSDVTKTDLEFFKIDAGGLINDATPPGTWASDKLIAANNSWTVTIPSDIAPGNYVLRHEIIALHSAGQTDGAQNYPQCINLQVTGGGSATPSGESAEKFYTPSAPGILIDIYSAISKYVIPGPALYSGGSGGSPPASSAPAAPSSSAAPVSSAAPSSVAPSAPAQSAPAPSYSAPAQSGGASYSAPAASGSASYSAPAASGSASYSGPHSSSPPASSSAGAASGSSAYGSSSSKCTSTITLSSSVGAASASSKPYYASSSAPVAPAGSSSTYIIPSGTAPSGPASTGGFSVPYPTGTSAPYPSSSAGAASGSASYSAPPAPSASAPAGYPTPPAPGSDMDSLMMKIVKFVKTSFRQAEHAKDFKKF